jgi:NADPH:quinone reductase-like Zn-dependent oxidoreductase
MSPTNEAAWLMGPCVHPLEVRPTPYTTPDADQMVVKNHAVAINPMDWAKQHVGDKKWDWLPHPFVLGEDIAGEVVEVGSKVTRFKVGDRVIAHAVGFYVYGCRTAESGFQLYTIAREHMATPIPDSLSYENAVVIPMACSAAACALLQKDFLALDYPIVPAAPLNGQAVLITGAATAVGSNAIQLARYGGYEVVTTCSPRNFETAKRLGASHAFDYNSPTIEHEIVESLKGKRLAGAFAIGPDSVELCVKVLGSLNLGDDSRKLVVKASFPWPAKTLDTDEEYDDYMKWVGGWNQSVAELAEANGVETKYVEGAELGRNEVSTKLYVDFLPRALGEGLYIPAPEPLIVGHGLEYIQEALDVRMKGVSAKKVVVTLGDR